MFTVDSAISNPFIKNQAGKKAALCDQKKLFGRPEKCFMNSSLFFIKCDIRKSTDCLWLRQGESHF
jgi:hypothetical protein